MILSETYGFIDNINMEIKDMDKEELKATIERLVSVTKEQNNTIIDVQNNYIRLFNNYNLIQDKIENYNAYKRLCETILTKIDANPISALWFLYSVKRKIANFEKN